ncbi:MAG: diacylglycerol kinase family lipid kinase [Chloroflexi bacterium]|nr:diacylglycerol kinase family lipid kinase [Chloroflexota bacterium]
MRRARLILNPVPWTRRAWNRLPDITNLLEEAGVRVDLAFTKLATAITQSVVQAAQEGYDLVIAGGGDGTVSEVAAGLVGTGVPLGILPFGTYNNIAHNLSLPLDLAEAALAIVKGNTMDVDVGVANGVYFFEAVGVGLDARLFPIGEEIKEGHYEKMIEGALAFLRHRKAVMSLRLDGEEMELRSPLVVVANGTYYGAGFTIAPQASVVDGLLEVVIFDCAKWEMARHFTFSPQSRERQEPCISRLQAEEITISSESPLPAHADGKPIAVPVTCRVIPKSLRVFVP